MKARPENSEALPVNPETSISLKVDRDFITFSFAEIIYTQSLGNYVKISTTHGSYVCSITTTELEKRLPLNLFQRIHKSHIVALDKITRFNQSTLTVGEELLPVGITYRRELAERLSKRL